MGKQQQSQFRGILARFPEDAVAGRAAQDHEQAAGTAKAPSLRPEADDGQWSQQPDEIARSEAPECQQPGERAQFEQPDDPVVREQARHGGR